MVPPVIKELLIPGSFTFFLLAATVGTLLLYRKKTGGAGRVLLTALLLFYWLISTPAVAVAVVGAFSPNHPPIQGPADARGATAIVVLGAGMQTYRSRGELFHAGSREHALRMLEAARVYRVLDRPWVVVSGTLWSDDSTDAVHMAQALVKLGVPEDRILQEGKSTNTRDHAMYVPPILAGLGVQQFVVVTSRQHMARSLAAFRAVGLDPIPSSPEFYVGQGRPLEDFLPSRSALEVSTAMIYDLGAMLYYRVRGWA